MGKIIHLEPLKEEFKRSKFIDPIRRTKEINQRVLGEAVLYTDRPVLAAYNVSRHRGGDDNLGPQYSIDPIGCPYACAFCWVHPAALAGSMDSKFLQNKAAKKTGEFRGELIHDAGAVVDRLFKRMRKDDIRVLSITGAETTTYRGAIKTIAERAQKEGIHVNIDTMGLQIDQCPEYLDAFRGLEDTLGFYISVKHVDPGEFERLTGVDRAFMDVPFRAMEKALKKGFTVMPGGIILNTFATSADLAQRPNHVTVLYDRLAAIHPRLPALLSCDKMTYLVHDPKAVAARMKARGYTDTEPQEVLKAVMSYWEERGTPLKRGTFEHPSLEIFRNDWKAILADMREDNPGPKGARIARPGLNP